MYVDYCDLRGWIKGTAHTLTHLLQAVCCITNIERSTQIVLNWHYLSCVCWQATCRSNKACQNTECVLLLSLRVLACITIVRRALDNFTPTLHSYTQLPRSMTGWSHNRTHNVSCITGLMTVNLVMHSKCTLSR